MWGVDDLQADATQRSGEIQVIGVGFSGAGTASLHAALTRLGYKPYGLREAALGFVVNFETGIWSDFFAGVEEGVDRSDAALDHIEFEGYDAVVGFPASLLYEHIRQQKQQATKVILSLSVTPETWVETLKMTFGKGSFLRATARRPVT